MRELVYLSTRKLGNFIEPKKLLSILSMIKRFDISAAELATFGVETHSPTEERSPAYTNKLERVIKKIAPKSLNDPTLSPGEWVKFESRMTHAALDREFMSGVIFLNNKSPNSRNGQPRLLLHGSSAHYHANQPKQLDIDSEVSEGYENFAGSNSGYVTRLANDVRGVVYSLERTRDFSELSPSPEFAQEGFVTGVMKLLLALDKKLPPSMLAENFSGLARLTCEPIRIAPGLSGRTQTQDRLIVGTPLYIEYAT